MVKGLCFVVEEEEPKASLVLLPLHLCRCSLCALLRGCDASQLKPKRKQSSANNALHEIVMTTAIRVAVLLFGILSTVGEGH